MRNAPAGSDLPFGGRWGRLLGILWSTYPGWISAQDAAIRLGLPQDGGLEAARRHAVDIVCKMRPKAEERGIVIERDRRRGYRCRPREGWRQDGA